MQVERRTAHQGIFCRVKISIVTVTYNSAATLRDTLESVLAQDYADIEYIVADGASTDGTVALLRQYESRFNGRMRWKSEPDEGLYDAMNKGIRLATGDVVGIINSDDFYNHTDVISRVAEAFASPGVQAVYGDVRFVHPGNLCKTVRYYSSRSFAPWKFRYGWMPAHPTFFTYRRYFEQYGYYRTDYRIAADYELLIRYLHTHRLSSRYLAFDFMKMRTGGASTRSWRSNICLNREIVKACRENGIYTNMPLLMLKYFVKVFEYFNTEHR